MLKEALAKVGIHPRDVAADLAIAKYIKATFHFPYPTTKGMIS